MSLSEMIPRRPVLQNYFLKLLSHNFFSLSLNIKFTIHMIFYKHNFQIHQSVQYILVTKFISSLHMNFHKVAFLEENIMQIRPTYPY